MISEKYHGATKLILSKIFSRFIICNEMELRHLRYFVTVAETGSFTRAAEILHTAQPSLSRQIKDLEHEVGTELLRRNSRMLKPTPAGAVFLEEARLVLAQSERAVERARQVARAGARRFTLGFLPGVEIELLVRVMTALQAELKPVEVTMRSRPSPELIAALHEGHIDAAFVRPDDSCKGLEVRVVRSERLMAALPSTHRLAKLERISVDDFNREAFINVPTEHAPALRRIIDEYIRSHNIQPDRTYDAENLTMTFSLISSIGGISLLPEYAFRLCPPTVVAVPLASDSPTIDLALAYRSDNRSSVLREFLEGFFPTPSIRPRRNGLGVVCFAN
jgi:LysR family transcriptional regulator, hca operon transcriptional activator